MLGTALVNSLLGLIVAAMLAAYFYYERGRDHRRVPGRGQPQQLLVAVGQVLSSSAEMTFTARAMSG